MKKALTFCLLSLFIAAGARAAADRPTQVIRVESCEAIIREFMASPSTAIPPAVWQRAKAVLILNEFKAGFLFGVKGGYGVILVRKPDGRWSLPVLLSAAEGSVGLQVGAKSVESVVVMTDENLPHLLFNRRFNIGVDAKAVAGPTSAETEHDVRPTLIGAPVLIYTKSEGLFAGATVKAGYVTRDDEANFVLYNTHETLPELLYSDWVQPPPEVQPLMSFLDQIAP